MNTTDTHPDRKVLQTYTRPRSDGFEVILMESGFIHLCQSDLMGNDDSEIILNREDATDLMRVLGEYLKEQKETENTGKGVHKPNGSRP